jgi:hypothetical protein
VASQCRSLCELFGANFTLKLFHVVFVSNYSHLGSTLVLDDILNLSDGPLPVLKEILHFDTPSFDAFLQHQGIFHLGQEIILGEA